MVKMSVKVIETLKHEIKIGGYNQGKFHTDIIHIVIHAVHIL